VTGEAVRDAQAVIDTQQLTSQWMVNVTFAGDGGREWEELTGDAACHPPGDPRRRIAIVLDREVISSPEVSPEIQCDVGIGGGTTSITGDFTDSEAKDLALLIRAGALPVPVEIVEQRTIGPTLGEAAIRASVFAALVGAALTLVYMVAYYRLLGALAALALLLYGLFSFAALTGIGATLTLPGIAGFVLAIGMAVDANVLVFERMKEEYAAGQRLGPAAANGFKDPQRRMDLSGHGAPSPTPTPPRCWPPSCCSSWPRARSRASASPSRSASRSRCSRPWW
jgi:SecD/SecF fusion protein